MFSLEGQGRNIGVKAQHISPSSEADFVSQTHAKNIFHVPVSQKLYRPSASYLILAVALNWYMLF